MNEFRLCIVGPGCFVLAEGDHHVDRGAFQAMLLHQVEGVAVCGAPSLYSIIDKCLTCTQQLSS